MLQSLDNHIALSIVILHLHEHWVVEFRDRYLTKVLGNHINVLIKLYF